MSWVKKEGGRLQLEPNIADSRRALVEVLKVDGATKKGGSEKIPPGDDFSIIHAA